MILPIFAPSHPEYTGFDPPRKQIAYGVLPENVNCKEGLVLFIKYNGSPACVKVEEGIIRKGSYTIMPYFSYDKSKPELQSALKPGPMDRWQNPYLLIFVQKPKK